MFHFKLIKLLSKNPLEIISCCNLTGKHGHTAGILRPVEGNRIMTTDEI
jgi:hypothetical protein